MKIHSEAAYQYNSKNTLKVKIDNPDGTREKLKIKEKVEVKGKISSNQENEKQIYSEKEKSNVTYKATGALEEKERPTIEQLRLDSEKAHQQLRRLVMELLQRQGYTVEEFMGSELENIEFEVDKTAMEEAARLISEDGPLGAEAVSDRIVDFAKALSDGDKAKISLLKSAIDAGFKAAEKALGGLPEISQRTYDLIMEKLEKWENGTEGGQKNEN